MILSFKDKETEKIWNRTYSKKFPLDFQRLAYRKLVLLHSVGSFDDLKVPPGNRLEKLKGDRTGQYSIRINDQFRICFNWSGQDASNVEIVDYH